MGPATDGAANSTIIRLFATVRWKMLRGALASDGVQKWAVAVGVIGSALLGAVAAASVFVAGQTSDDSALVFVGFTTAAMFVVVMIGVIAGVTQPVDPRVLATEPITERQLGVGMLAASAAGPAGLSAALFGIGLVAGAVGGLASIVPATVAAAAVLATLLLVSRTTINALGLLSTRHPRAGQAIVGMSSLVFYAAFQIAPRSVADLDDDDRGRLVDGLTLTPMGQLGRALAVARDDPLMSLVHTMIGAVWLVPLLLLFTWTTRRLITSVKGAGARGGSNRERRRPVATIARRLCGPGEVGALAWRGVLTRLRTPRTALETFTGAGVGLAIVLVPVVSGREAGAGAVLVGGAVQLAVLFMAGNSFGSDGPAMANELLTGADPTLLVRAKARSVVVCASPVAVIGPLIAAAATDQWQYLPAGFAVGIGGLLAGSGAAMVQSSIVPIAIPDSDNPLASGESGRGCFAGLMLGAVLLALAILTLPVALALVWALERDSPALVSLGAVAAIGAGLLVLHGGVAIAAGRWRTRGPELFAAITPVR